MLAALPLLAVSITTDPREVSWVNVAGQSPWLLFSLFAGVLIDRVRRTTVLAWAYAVQVLAAVTLAIAGSARLLSLPLLLIVAFVVTSAQVLGDGASGALVPEVVPPERFTAANTRLQLIDRGVVQFIVPPLTGWLVVVSAGMPAWLACVAAALALVLARGVSSASVVPSQAHPLRDIGEGLKYLVGTPLLRSITVTVALGSFAASAGNAMLVLYATQVLHIGSVGYGALLACLAAGWVLSSFAVHRIVARLGYSRSMRLAQLFATVTQLIIVVFLALDIPPFAAVVYATGVAAAFALIARRRDLRGWAREMVGALATGVRAALPVIAVCAAAGVITSAIAKTGLGLELADALVELARAITSNPTAVLILTVVLSAVRISVLGLAVPVTAPFIIAWVVLGPALESLGVATARDPRSVDLPGVEPLRLDVTGPESIAAAAAATGDATLVINDAGISTHTHLTDGVIDNIRLELETHFFGSLGVTRAFAPVLAANGGGGFLNVLSLLWWLHVPDYGAYSAAKAAAWAMTNVVRLELAPKGSR